MRSVPRERAATRVPRDGVPRVRGRSVKAIARRPPAPAAEALRDPKAVIDGSRTPTGVRRGELTTVPEVLARQRATAPIDDPRVQDQTTVPVVLARQQAIVSIDDPRVQDQTTAPADLAHPETSAPTEVSRVQDRTVRRVLALPVRQALHRDPVERATEGEMIVQVRAPGAHAPRRRRAVIDRHVAIQTSHGPVRETVIAVHDLRVAKRAPFVESGLHLRGAPMAHRALGPTHRALGPTHRALTDRALTDRALTDRALTDHALTDRAATTAQWGIVERRVMVEVARRRTASRIGVGRARVVAIGAAMTKRSVPMNRLDVVMWRNPRSWVGVPSRAKVRGICAVKAPRWTSRSRGRVRNQPRRGSGSSHLVPLEQSVMNAQRDESLCCPLMSKLKFAGPLR